MSSTLTCLSRCSPQQLLNFFSIRDDEVPKGDGEDRDLFIGKNIHITITLNNGSLTKFRDIVVLGKLTIHASSADKSSRPTLECRDIIVAGSLDLKHFNLKNRYYIGTSPDPFKNALMELVLDWFDAQREHTRKMGLRSVLI
ncbi:MAG: hypothetical protein JSR37_08520 [Verrucomicrobia bacterium]|nr:hypothetical protein [Verrucomicrobiota bacterium]MBS0636728.1 hypothetical protein [Verrucomicrobiota bacterium]